VPRIVAALLVLALAACSAQSAPSASPSPNPSAGSDAPTGTPRPSSPAPSGSPEPSEPPAPTWTGHPADGLAFTRVLDENDPITQVFVVEPDGTLRQVTGLSAELGASHPVWSPDGGRLAFTGPKHGETTFRGMVAVVDADGTNERQVAEGQFPRWSPDGTMIAFQEVDDVTDADHSFYVVDPDTGEVTDLGLGYEPRWLDDGHVAFGANTHAADGAVTSSLYFMDLATGDVQRIADWTRAFPSPDGSMLLLEHEGTVSLASPDGSVVAELAQGGDPVWAPDGSRVAVMVGHDADANPVWAIVDVEGNLLRTDIVGEMLTWSPDGTRVATQVHRPEMPVIQVVDLATGEIAWEMEGMQPAWRP